MSMNTKRKVRPIKIPRHEADMLRSLAAQISLLDEHSLRAFDQSDFRYLGEVAAKLRLLVVESRHNQPLLLDLMAKFKSRTLVLVDEPPKSRKLSLRDYMNELCFAGLAPSGQRVSLTRAEFVKTWAEQHGGAHEDPAHDETYVAAQGGGLLVGGMQPHVRLLRSIARTVLSVAHSFREELEGRSVRTEEA